MMKNPNPQGKGLVPVLDCLAASRVRIAVAPKTVTEVANELFTSLFVLGSQFQFRPKVGEHYWLYRKNTKYRLSMIAPQEWGGDSFGEYIGECVLQADLTWTLQLGETASCDSELLASIAARREEFEQALQQAESLEDALPVYLPSLPFYSRVFAASLANSLRVSMQLSGIDQLAYAQAQGLLSQS